MPVLEIKPRKHKREPLTRSPRKEAKYSLADCWTWWSETRVLHFKGRFGVGGCVEQAAKKLHGAKLGGWTQGGQTQGCLALAKHTKLPMSCTPDTNHKKGHIDYLSRPSSADDQTRRIDRGITQHSSSSRVRQRRTGKS